MTPLQSQRRRDFIKACIRETRAAAGTSQRLTDTIIARRAMAGGAPGYYLEYDYALKVLYGYYAQGELPIATPHRRAMWLELIAKVDELRNRGVSVMQALNRVLSGATASRFFIAEATAVRELRNHRRSPL